MPGTEPERFCCKTEFTTSKNFRQTQTNHQISYLRSKHTFDRHESMNILNSLTSSLRKCFQQVRLWITRKIDNMIHMPLERSHYLTRSYSFTSSTIFRLLRRHRGNSNSQKLYLYIIYYGGRNGSLGNGSYLAP